MSASDWYCSGGRTSAITMRCDPTTQPWPPAELMTYVTFCVGVKHGQRRRERRKVSVTIASHCRSSGTEHGTMIQQAKQTRTNKILPAKQSTHVGSDELDYDTKRPQVRVLAPGHPLHAARTKRCLPKMRVQVGLAPSQGSGTLEHPRQHHTAVNFEKRKHDDSK
jgi:hypothetical protein